MARRQFNSPAARRRPSATHYGSKSASATGGEGSMSSIMRIGAMVAGVMDLATQDYRVGANTLNETRAGAAAEMGLNRTLTDWDKTRNNTMAAGDTVRKSYTDPSGATANVFITRLAGP